MWQCDWVLGKGTWELLCFPFSPDHENLSLISLILFPSSEGLDGNENDSLKGHELKMTVFVSLLAWIIFRKVVSVAQKYQLWATIWQREGRTSHAFTPLHISLSVHYSWFSVSCTCGYSKYLMIDGQLRHRRWRHILPDHHTGSSVSWNCISPEYSCLKLVIIWDIKTSIFFGQS